MININKPKTVARAELVQAAWKNQAPEEIFGGLGLEDHKVALAGVRKAETQVEALEVALKGARELRDDRVVELALINRKVYHGVLGHPDYGDDCATLAQMGYVRRSKRASGLTRRELPGDAVEEDPVPEDPTVN